MKRRKAENRDTIGVDLTFLPQEFQNKINEVFDLYFGLSGLKCSKPQESSKAFPNKISSLDSNQIANIHANYTAWLGYMQDRLKYVTVAYGVIEKEVKEVYNTEYLNSKGSNKEKREAEAKTSESYKALSNYRMKVEGVKIMFDQQVSLLDKQLMSLARELRRRENIFKND